MCVYVCVLAWQAMRGVGLCCGEGEGELMATVVMRASHKKMSKMLNKLYICGEG